MTDNGAVIISGWSRGIGLATAMIAERWPKVAAEIPLGRIGRTQGVASVLALLCSSGASYITGQTIQVDGGIVRR